MAHLVDGVLSMPVVIGGAVVAVGAVGYGLRQVEGERIPYVGLMSAAFFVATLVHVPVGPSNVHLILNGLLGAVLGAGSVPGWVVALIGTGFCGTLTTFSTFGADVVRLVEERALGRALGYMAATLVLGLGSAAAAYIGVRVS